MFLLIVVRTAASSAAFEFPLNATGGAADAAMCAFISKFLHTPEQSVSLVECLAIAQRDRHYRRCECAHRQPSVHHEADETHSRSLLHPPLALARNRLLAGQPFVRVADRCRRVRGRRRFDARCAAGFLRGGRLCRALADLRWRVRGRAVRFVELRLLRHGLHARLHVRRRRLRLSVAEVAVWCSLRRSPPLSHELRGLWPGVRR